jgi:hypothetical protein
VRKPERILQGFQQKEVSLGEEVILAYDAVYHQQYKRWLDQVIYYNKEYVSINEEKGALKNFLSETVAEVFKPMRKAVRISGNRDFIFKNRSADTFFIPVGAIISGS